MALSLVGNFASEVNAFKIQKSLSSVISWVFNSSAMSSKRSHLDVYKVLWAVLLNLCLKQDKRIAAVPRKERETHNPTSARRHSAPCTGEGPAEKPLEKCLGVCPGHFPGARAGAAGKAFWKPPTPICCGRSAGRCLHDKLCLSGEHTAWLFTLNLR